jgi:hypothetical protein
VRAAIEGHFAAYARLDAESSDYAFADDLTGVEWIVEIKGGDDAPSPGFTAALGRLVAGTSAGQKANYVLAMPDTAGHRTAREAVAPWLREAMNLIWFLVDERGEIIAIRPNGREPSGADDPIPPPTRTVTPNPRGGWDVTKPGASRASSHHSSEADARSAARRYLERSGGGELIVHGRDGRVYEKDSVSHG